MDMTNRTYLRISRKALEVARAKGWTEAQIRQTFEQPKAVYASKTYKGQWRVAGKEICLVGVPLDDYGFLVITVMMNGSVYRAA